METILLAILIIISIAIFFKKPNVEKSYSQEFLLNLNENLRKEIQDIRKEMTNNSEIGRKEIEEKLKDINKGIINFQTSSKEDMQKQFTSSNKVIKEVTADL